MSAVVKFWECSECGVTLLKPWLPCLCPNTTDRFLVTPYGTIPAIPLGTGPLEIEREVA